MKMHTVYTVNVGLKPSVNTTRQEPITRLEVLAALRGAGFKVLSYQEAQSETERTAVVVVTTGWPEATSDRGHFYNVSVALSQDCVAVLSARTGHGYLTGPNAADWGEFNLAYFITEEEAAEMFNKAA